MYTREQYLSGECTYDEYWSQLVKPCITNLVLHRFGVAYLRSSTDPHMNDIPLYQWDSLHEAVRKLIASNTDDILTILRRLDKVQAKLAEKRKFSWSISDSICVLKCAARMLITQK